MKGTKVRKQLFGSLHSVEIEFDSEELSPDIKGVIRVFERRHQVSESKFKNSKEFVMLLKEIWANFTRGGGAAWNVEQRIARWLEEYFQEIGHPVTYDELLELVRSGEVSVGKVLDEEKAEEIEDDLIKQITETPDEIVPVGEKIPVDEMIDEEKLRKAFKSLLKKHVPTPIEKIESKVKAQTASGKDVEFTVESPYNNMLGKEGGIITTKLVNSFNEELRNIEIESVIPYDLQVKEIKSNKEVEKKLIPEKEGLKAIISLSSLAPKELLDIEYEVSSRIRRVVQIQKENEILVLRTYLDIQEVGERYISRTLFVNNFDSTLNYIELVDFIPRSFKIVDTNPDLTEPLGELKYQANFNEVHWYHKEIPTGATLEKDYELILVPIIYRDKYEIRTGQDNKNVLLIYRSIISDKTDQVKSYYYVASNAKEPHKILIKDHLEDIENIEVLTPDVSELAIAEETSKFTLVYGPAEISPGKEVVFAVAFFIKEAYMPEKLEIFIDDKNIIVDSTSKSKEEEELPEEILPEEKILMFNF